jgi:hypothetical protein
MVGQQTAATAAATERGSLCHSLNLTSHAPIAIMTRSAQHHGSWRWRMMLEQCVDASHPHLIDCAARSDSPFFESSSCACSSSREYTAATQIDDTRSSAESNYSTTSRSALDSHSAARRARASERPRAIVTHLAAITVTYQRRSTRRSESITTTGSYDALDVRA